MIPANSRGISLRLPGPDDLEFMWRAEADEGRGSLWRTGGTTVGLDEFRTLIWANVLHQYLVVDAVDNRLGVVMSYDYNPWDGHVKAGLCSYSGNGTGAFIGFALAIEQIFNSVPVRRIYFEIPEGHADRFSGALSRLCTNMGSIRDYQFAEGRWTSLSVWSMERQRWVSPDSRKIRRLVTGVE